MIRLDLKRVVGLLVAAAVLAPSTAASATVRPQTSAVYGSLGSWVDIFAKQAWRNPDAVVASLRAHGVATLYLQTSNYSQITSPRWRIQLSIAGGRSQRSRFAPPPASHSTPSPWTSRRAWGGACTRETPVLARSPRR